MKFRRRAGRCISTRSAGTLAASRHSGDFGGNILIPLDLRGKGVIIPVPPEVGRKAGAGPKPFRPFPNLENCVWWSNGRSGLPAAASSPRTASADEGNAESILLSRNHCISFRIPRVRPHPGLPGPGSVRKVEMEWPRYKGHMVNALALEVDEGRGQLR